jgi:hypothetical protein
MPRRKVLAPPAGHAACAASNKADSACQALSSRCSQARYQRLVDEALDGDVEPLTHRHQLGTIAGACARVCLKHGRPPRQQE